MNVRIITSTKSGLLCAKCLIFNAHLQGGKNQVIFNCILFEREKSSKFGCKQACGEHGVSEDGNDYFLGCAVVINNLYPLSSFEKVDIDVYVHETGSGRWMRGWVRVG